MYKSIYYIYCWVSNKQCSTETMSGLGLYRLPRHNLSVPVIGVVCVVWLLLESVISFRIYYYGDCSIYVTSMCGSVVIVLLINPFLCRSFSHHLNDDCITIAIVLGKAGV